MTTTVETTKVLELAQAIQDSLTKLDLSSSAHHGYREQRVIWKDDAVAELKDWWRETSQKIVSSDINELDEVYSMLETTADIILDYVTADTDNVIETVREAISMYEFADVYNADRLEWLLESLGREEECNQAAADTGITGIFDSIAIGQEQIRNQYCQRVFDAILDRLNIADE